MSDIFGNTFGAEQTTHKPCRVAYTLNNDQPVRCTIIGDQPLFYMDYECDYEDDDLFDAAELKMLENEILALKHEMDGVERFSTKFAQTPEEHYAAFVADRDSLTQPFIAGDTLSLENLKQALTQSRLGAAYIAFAEEHGVVIKFSAQVDGASYDRKSGIILINPNIDHAEQILLAARELRRHWQHRQGALIHPLMFHPDNAVLVNRAQVADLVTSMVRVAWELQLSGTKEVWERLENSSMADVCRAFAREAFLDFRTINNGQAAAAVFESWFLSERCRLEDKKLIQQMLADYQGYVFDLEEASKSITPALIAALGEMPYGKNYLSEHTNTIMEDPIFTDVRDRSNANFLWFIKFERSFRETEQELQSTDDQSAGGVRHSVFNTQTQDHNHGQASQGQSTAQVVSLYPGNETGTGEESARRKLLREKSGKKNSEKSGGAEIIYLRRWSGE
jgi:hypothetical protein